jgi:hypothetical protein
MTKFRQSIFDRLFIRDLNADSFLDNFFISAVSAVLLIRFFLHLTNYPRIGGESLHVAHVLWGGLIMLIALIMLLLFINRSIKYTASIIGGFGFGTFIDELGKFITSDNNYLYEPTVALIYVVFILLYLSFEALAKLQNVTQKEYLINALEMIKEAVEKNMDEEEKKQVQSFLEKSDKKDLTTQTLLKILEKTPSVPVSTSWLSRTRHFVNETYQVFLRTRWFLRAVLAIFIIKSLISFFSSGGVIVNKSTLSFTDQIEMFSVLTSGVLVLIGVITIYRSRLSSYRYFKYSLLISIFLTQFFTFYRDQFSALSDLIVNLSILTIINYLISQEKPRNQE